jgi:hypothetical protein
VVIETGIAVIETSFAVVRTGAAVVETGVVVIQSGCSDVTHIRRDDNYAALIGWEN